MTANLDNIKPNPRLTSNRMKIEHVSEGTVGESRTKDGNAIAPRPVAYGPAIVDLAAKSVDQLKKLC